MSTHKHKCGFSVVPQEGCGYEWEHDSSEIKGKEEYDAAHHCPRCNAGPWILKVDDESREIVNVPFNERHPVDQLIAILLNV